MSSKRIPVLNRIGQRFGRLLVVSLSCRTPRGMAVLECLCDCGCSKFVQLGDLITGRTLSCGCLKVERTISSNRCNKVTHGKSASPEYYVWRGLVSRCTNPNNPNYSDYGGRGIRVCDEWLKFENFYQDMGDRPSPKHTLDRRYVDGDYCKENCRWATQKEQQNNRRNNAVLCLDDVNLTQKQWSEKTSIAQSTIHNRLRRGWSVEEALRTPVGKKRGDYPRHRN